jgi:hypothetical protein
MRAAKATGNARVTKIIQEFIEKRDKFARNWSHFKTVLSVSKNLFIASAF